MYLEYDILEENKKFEMEVERVNARQVEICVEFFRIGEIDTMNERYNAEFNIEAKWIDFNMAITDKYDTKVHWNPQIFIENALNTVQTVNYDLEKRADGAILVTERRNIKGLLYTLFFKDFILN
jgi:hypothetical protein